MQLDIIILVILFFGLLDGQRNGFFVEFLSIFGVVVNFYLSEKITPIVMERYNFFQTGEFYIFIYMVIFIGVFFLVGIVIKLLRTLLFGVPRGLIIRLLGGVVGILKALLISIVVLFGFNFASQKYDNLKKYGENSYSMQMLYSLMPMIENNIPLPIKKQIKDWENKKFLDNYLEKLRGSEDENENN